ncbi:MAG: hypothetical protein ACI9E1_000941 [Cryomorphaceae bacterium]
MRDGGLGWVGGSRFIVHCSLFIVHCSLFIVHCSKSDVAALALVDEGGVGVASGFCYFGGG